MNEKKLYLLQTLPEGQIIELDLQTGKHRFILEKLNTHPDGIAVDIAQSRIYWTNMGTNLILWSFSRRMEVSRVLI
jgi:hypothetical protein